MIIVQMTDLHVVAAGTLLYGEYDTNARLERAVAHVNAMAPRPDVVVLTGDLVDKGTVEEYELLRSMLDELAATKTCYLATVTVPKFLTRRGL